MMIVLDDLDQVRALCGSPDETGNRIAVADEWETVNCPTCLAMRKDFSDLEEELRRRFEG